MGRFLATLRGTIVRYWTIGDMLTRIPLIGILLWPFVLFMVAIIGWPPLTAIAAMFPVLPLVVILTLSPVATGLAWSTPEGRELIRTLITVTAVELLIGLYLVFVPVENNRGLAPVFVLAAVTQALFLASGLTTTWAKAVMSLLWFLLGTLTAWFYITPHWTAWKTAIKASNPVPWWGFLLIAVLVALAILNAFRGWKSYAALAVLAIVVFTGWHVLYPKEGARDTHFVVKVGPSFRDSIPIAPTENVRWAPRTAVAYDVRTADGGIVSYPLVGSDTVRIKAPLSPYMYLRTVGPDSAEFDFYISPPGAGR